MASYFLHVKTFSRGKGSSATKAAAYRSGERIPDDRSGAVHDYTDRSDVAHTEIVLPAEYTGSADMEWARNRSVLWNAVQGSGRLWNSRLAREVLVHVPPEMTRVQRAALVRGFSRELADRYHCAVDFAVHEPRAHADQRHHHAHILMTTRQVGPEGIGARTTLDLSGTERRARGLGPSKDDLLWIRERWAQVTNEALREAGLAARVDHRSYAAQGIDREPKALIPQKVLYAERRSGRNTEAGDRIRESYRERVEARLKGLEEYARVVKRQREENRERLIQSTQRQEDQTKRPNGALTREQLNERRREYCKTNAERINRKQRERRRANADEVNRKQREYNRKRTAQHKAAKSSSSTKEQLPTEAQGRAPPTEQSPTSALQASTPVSAEESVKHWLAFRAERNPAPDKDSLAGWLAYRESQATAARAENRSPDHTADPGAGGKGPRDTEPAGNDPQRGHKNDLGY